MTFDTLIPFFPKLTPRRYQDLTRVFSSFEALWQVNADDLKPTHWDSELIHAFIEWRDALNIEIIEHELLREGITVIPQTYDRYPTLLKQLYDPPPALFVRGNLSATDICFAVVGTRKCTSYGKQVTEELIPKLVAAGLTIVSGLALGIDGVAHEATLRAGGKTIAVLGSGVDHAHVFPTSHSDLAKRIVEHGGAVISEYPPGTLSTTFTFPRRNRIIAGLSIGTLVIEAPASSGALITAQCALENNREVFAIPQNITSETSIGPNTLIKNGAHPVTTIDDMLEVLPIEAKQSQAIVRTIIPDSPTEATLISILTRDPIHIDAITKQSKLPAAIVGSTLTLMEMKGMVRNVGGMNYVMMI